ncbi:hypothetical protein, partial [Pseudomonas lactis]|uniref:hypothetical protein n=1 Tax=Pseudomonas lactis TaxID=1615674 RepID=UPI001E4002E3
KQIKIKSGSLRIVVTVCCSSLQSYVDTYAAIAVFQSRVELTEPPLSQASQLPHRHSAPLRARSRAISGVIEFLL